MVYFSKTESFQVNLKLYKLIQQIYLIVEVLFKSRKRRNIQWLLKINGYIIYLMKDEE